MKPGDETSRGLPRHLSDPSPVQHPRYIIPNTSSPISSPAFPLEHSITKFPAPISRPKYAIPDVSPLTFIPLPIYLPPIPHSRYRIPDVSHPVSFTRCDISPPISRYRHPFHDLLPSSISHPRYIPLSTAHSSQSRYSNRGIRCPTYHSQIYPILDTLFPILFPMPQPRYITPYIPFSTSQSRYRIPDTPTVILNSRYLTPIYPIFGISFPMSHRRYITASSPSRYISSRHPILSIQFPIFHTRYLATKYPSRHPIPNTVTPMFQSRYLASIYHILDRPFPIRSISLPR